MAATENLIDFDIIESHKENIQSLPSGRSAKALATALSPPNLPPPFSPTSTLSPNDTRTTTRAAFERELLTLPDSDDPLDIYDRYVRWTLSAYPSAQATPASQLLPLLERATKAFLPPANQLYRNDPRYLKLWLHYIHLFGEGDAPRETFAYLARCGVGDALALFYEEFAAWLEGRGRWAQAEEVYRMGVEGGARPVERLVRKFAEFQRRREVKAGGVEEPSSPALPTVRPVLAERRDPFSTAEEPIVDVQAQARRGGSGVVRGKKLAIFADGAVEPSPVLGAGAGGWSSIGSIAERKKENTIGARPWVGETLKAGGANVGMQKMTVFKDESSSNVPKILPTVQTLHDFDNPPHDQRVVSQRSGKTELVFVNLEAVYPNPDDPSVEFCFEELRAAKRGWLQRNWAAERKNLHSQPQTCVEYRTVVDEENDLLLPENECEVEQVAEYFQQTLLLNDENIELDGNAAPETKLQQRQDNINARERLRREERANRTRKIKVGRVRGDTQTIQINLESPRGPRLRRKKSVEPTVTVHTKAATDEIYAIFNQPLKSAAVEEIGEDGTDDGSGGEYDEYGSASESTGTGTGRISRTASECGEDTQNDLTSRDGPDDKDETSNDTGWSEFTIHEKESLETAEEENVDQTDLLLESDAQPDLYAVRGVANMAQVEVTAPISPSISPYSSVEAEVRCNTIIDDHDHDHDPDPLTMPYRDAVQMAQSRLPFMTPIVEATESSLGTTVTGHNKDYFTAKTPCPKTEKTPNTPDSDEELWSSPFEEVYKDVIRNHSKMPQPVLTKLVTKTTEPEPESAGPAASSRLVKRSVQVSRELTQRGPIFKDLQCNPMDVQVHEMILREAQPPLSTFDGYFQRTDVISSRQSEIRKYCASVAKYASKGSRNNEKTNQTVASPPLLQFDGAERDYLIKRELGKGAFAPVYLAEQATQQVDQGGEKVDGVETAPAVMGKGRFASHPRNRHLEAIKMEEPPSAWEFYMLRLAKRRLGVSRAADSIVHAHEMHLFKDEGYLVEEYHDQGTLLDLVNLARAEQAANGAVGTGGMDEMLAMFFAVELLRTLEGLHSKGIIHGDLKADNVLVRFDEADELSAQYRRDGVRGWAAKGICLIDFGRGIDMRAFRPDVQFVADWETSATDCAEMREMRPWTWQIDYFGLAAILHTMLFGKYIETVAEKGGSLVGGATKTYKLKEGLKRYWQTEIWAEVFTLLLNPLRCLEGEEGAQMPVLRGMKACREKMEVWLEGNAEKGVGLKGMVRRMEALLGEKKRRG